MNKKLHILFLSSWYPSRVAPDNGNFVQRHAEAVATKHNVTSIYSIRDNSLKSTYLVDNVLVNNVNTITIYFKGTSIFIINIWRKFMALQIGMKGVNNIDIIHGNILNPIGIFVWLISKLKKTPYIFTEHWSGFLPEDTEKISYFKKPIIKFIVANANYLICVSNSLKLEMLRSGYKGHFKVIGNIVDTKLFFPKAKTKQLFEIVHISNFHEESKNISGILFTIKKLSEIRSDFIFKLIGNNNNELLKVIRQFDIPLENIKIEGFKAPSEIASILQKANLYISFSNYETFGIVMTEALACGTPVISTDTGILNEMEPQDFISIIPKNDNEVLLQTIIKYLNCNAIFDSSQMHKLIDQQFGSEKIINAYNQVYTNVISSCKKSNL